MTVVAGFVYLVDQQTSHVVTPTATHPPQSYSD